MLPQTQRMDPLFYIATSNGAGAQTLLKEYGYPEIDDAHIVFDNLKQLVKAHPEQFNILMTEYHPDKAWFTQKPCTCGKGKNSYCAYCDTSNYTTEEAATMRQQLNAMDCAALQQIVNGVGAPPSQEYLDMAKAVAVAKKCLTSSVQNDGSHIPAAQHTTTGSIMENPAVHKVLNWASDNRKFLTGVAVGIVIIAIVKS